jgi:hypothetical protein
MECTILEQAAIKKPAEGAAGKDHFKSGEREKLRSI